MAFTQQHLYVTTHFLTPAGEEGQYGVRILRATLPSPTEATAIKNDCTGFFSATEMEFSGQMRVYRVKMAVIGTDGKYPAGVDPVIVDIASGAAGAGGGGGSRFPLQTAMVATLDTGFERGKAAHGRIYLPAPTSALDTNFNLLAAKAQAYATRTATFIRNIGISAGAPVAVMSFSGVTRNVTAVRIGDRLDVQRRRARQQVEVYKTAAV